MDKYDLILLLNTEAELKTIKELITSHSGKILKEEKWGKKELAYPIKKLTSALFFEYVFEIKQKDLLKFQKILNYNDKIIRYLLLKTEK